MRVLLLPLMLGGSCALGQTWAPLPDFPGTARDDGAAFAIGTDIYLGTGREVGWGLTADWHRFSTITNDWRQVASLPSAGRQYGTAFSIDGIGYLFGGSNDNGWLNELWAYDPATDSWLQRASLPSAGRSGSVSFAIDGYGYITNGRTGANTLSNELWRYDPASDAWLERAPMPGGTRHLSAAFVLGGTAYVVGGADVDATNLATGWSYDPGADAWSAIADFPDARFGADGFALNSHGLIIGGAYSLSDLPSTCYGYQPWDDTWVPTTQDVPGVRKGGSGAVVGGQVYYGTGVNTMDRLRDWHRMDGPVGIEGTGRRTELELFPNPALDHIVLKGDAVPAIKGAAVWNALGERIAQFERDELQRPMYIGHLSSGAYLLLIDTDEGPLVRPFLRMAQ